MWAGHWRGVIGENVVNALGIDVGADLSAGAGRV